MKCVKEQRHSQRGMTLIEMLLCLVLGDLFFILLSTIWFTCLKEYADMRKEQKLFYEANKVRQFIQDEVALAETVCIYVYENQVVETGSIIDLCHTKHNTSSYELPEGKERDVKQIIFDKGRRNKNNRDISTLLKRKNIKNNESTFELNYQDNTLADNLTTFRVKKQEGIFYMLLEMKEGEVFQFTLPIQDKGEKADAWTTES